MCVVTQNLSQIEDAAAKQRLPVDEEFRKPGA
jgi:hypothetical protein